jgi:hypothetical protein
MMMGVVNGKFQLTERIILQMDLWRMRRILKIVLSLRGFEM